MTLRPDSRIDVNGVTTIGPYEIRGKLGAGGMGEVYRAHDPRLDRDVAIKVLPAAFAEDHERLARFEREARALAALNHPNIAAIFGFEGDRPIALVMELVEGEDLSARIARGPIALAEALPIARQIADALEAAHERGIVHRDLKPANIKVRDDGAVKVLDFGLAKVTDGSQDLQNSPTMISPATQAGIILGTAGYMAPEQARGRPTDRRADIWAFGVVLLEMLTGRPVFSGGDVTEVLAAVLKDTPSLDRVPPATPASIRRLLKRCLEKDRAKRLDSMAVARLEIEDALTGASDPGTPQHPAAGRSTTSILPWAIAALALSAAAVAGYWSWHARPAPPPLARIGVDLGIGGPTASEFGPSFAVSPVDGAVVASADGPDNVRRLYVKRRDQVKAMALPGTEDGVDPFFSPDGQWVGFFTGSRMKKVALSGGAPVDLATIVVGRGGWWAEDGFIYFTPSPARVGRVFRIAESGDGEPQQVGELIEGHTTQRWPQVLPGARALIYTSHSNVDVFDEASLVVQTLDGGPPREVMKGGYYWRYLPSGHIVYVHNSTLFAVPFDLNRLEVTGTGVPIVEGLKASPTSGGAQCAFGSDGSLLYLVSAARTAAERLWWLDVSGAGGAPVPVLEANFQSLAVSPDGTKLALEVTEGAESPELWVHDLARDTRSRLTVNQVPDFAPVWTLDSTRVVYASATDGPPNLFWQRADGGGPPERLGRETRVQIPGNWHPDGNRLVFAESGAASVTRFDIAVLTMPARTVTRLTDTPASEFHPRFSPDGEWIAYTSDETGTIEVYVRSYPQDTGRWAVSTRTGLWPFWSPTDRVLFYTTLDGQLMRVPYEVVGGVFRPGRPEPVPNAQLVVRGVGYSAAIHPDGRRLIAPLQQRRDGPAARDEFVLVTGFVDDLKARIKPQ